MNIRGFLRKSDNIEHSNQLIDISLRIVRNQLGSGLLKPKDFADLDIIDDLASLTSNISRVLLVAEILT
jgi:hypothetical protein